MIRDNEEINVFDVERILGDFPIDLIKENIATQINDPLTYEADHCSSVYETFEEANNEFGHIEEYKEELTELKDKFNLFVLEALESKFYLGIDLNAMSEYEVEEMVKNCYEFFVVRLKENITSFLLNYINNNRMSISQLFEDQFRRKDVTTMNMKKLTKNREEVLILSNLPDVVNHILELEHQPEEFINLAAEPEEMVADYILSKTTDFTISGNFVPGLLNELNIIHNDTIDEIISSIRLELTNMIDEADLNPEVELED